MNYWCNNINVSAVINCALLSFSPYPLKEFSVDKKSLVPMSVETLSNSKQWLISEFGAPYVSFYGLSDRYDIKDIESVLLNQYSLFRARSGIFSELQDYVDRIMQWSENENSHLSADKVAYCYFDPKKIWYLYTDTAPELSAVAIALLSIVPSEAAVERSFSSQDSIHTKKRNRLHDSTVKAEMFILFNSAALDSNITPEGNYMELTDDNVEHALSDMVEAFAIDKEEKVNEDEWQAAEEEQEEEEKKQPISPTDAFIKHYAAQNGIHQRYKWVEYRINHLADAAAAWDPPILDTTDVLKKKIQNHVKVNK